MAQPIRALIVDDQPRSRNGLRALLTTMQLIAHDETWPEIEVVGEAANGQEALYQVEQLQPDIVLMDLRMPVMDGLEATRLIKSRWPEVKIIALTIYSAYRAEALAAQADAFLVKGCCLEELLQTIMLATIKAG